MKSKIFVDYFHYFWSGFKAYAFTILRTCKTTTGFCSLLLPWGDKFLIQFILFFYQVTRSIGDDDLKPAVTAEPEITETIMTPEDEYLVSSMELMGGGSNKKTNKQTIKFQTQYPIFKLSTWFTNLSFGYYDASVTTEENSCMFSLWYVNVQHFCWGFIIQSFGMHKGWNSELIVG